MYHIKTYNVISEVGLKELDPKNFVVDKSEDPDGIILRSQNLHKENFGSNLKAIVRAGAGYNNIPLEQAEEKGIVVFNTPGGNANAVKEMIFAMLLLSTRPIISAMNFAEHNVGADVSLRTEAKKNAYRGHELKGQTLGVIGLGHVGSKVANLGLDLGMKVIGFDPIIQSDAAWMIDQHVKRATDIKELLKKADYVTVHIPYNDDNDHFMDEKKISEMKKGAVLLNYSRTNVVDDDAVIKALDDKKIRLYISDFATEHLYDREDVIITPHIGGSTVEAENAAAKMAGDEMQKFLISGNIINSVNLPTINEPFVDKYRITAVHRNVPNMISKISSILGNFHVNIDRLSNRSKGNLAYTMIDINNFPLKEKDEILDALKNTSDIIKVRFLVKES